jgi:uncharacterized protein YndB with AHSA1/START domain
MTGHALTITRTFKGVSPARVYTAWTDPDLIAQWYGPEGASCTIHEMSVMSGGAYRMTMVTPGGETHHLRGKFLELAPPRKVVLTWQWADAQTPDSMGGGETRVTVTFREVGPDTEMIMIHDKFTNEVQVTNHNMGWSSSFNKLATCVSAQA